MLPDPPPPPAAAAAAADLEPAPELLLLAAAAAASRNPPLPSWVYLRPEKEGRRAASVSVTVVGLTGALTGDRPAGGELDREARFAMACGRSIKFVAVQLQLEVVVVVCVNPPRRKPQQLCRTYRQGKTV